jgi:hypothetical protein
MAEPGAALWTVVVGPWYLNFLGELRLPMDPFRAIGNAVRIWNPQPGIPSHHLVSQLVRADIEATPPLGIGNEAGDGHRPFHQRRECGIHRDVFPVAGLFATDRLVLVNT